MSDGTLNRGHVHEAIAAVMAAVGGVAKGRKNPSQGYMFRGIADITKACQPLMAAQELHVVPHAVLAETVAERASKSGGTMFHVRQTIEFRFYHADGSWVQCVTTGEAMDSGDKACNKVMSAALKYALIQTFCIPEEDPEVDTETASPEVKPSAPKEPAPSPPSSRSARPAAPGAGGRAASTNGGGLHVADDPGRDLQRLWVMNPPAGMGRSLTDLSKWLLETWKVPTVGKLLHPQLLDALTLSRARLEGGDEGYEAARAKLWAADHKIGPEADDLPEAMGGAPAPTAPKGAA